MKYINNKGYLTVEIILASSIAFVIAFFLFDVTMKLVDTTDNAFVDTVVTTDKALIVDNIKEQVQNDIKEYGVMKEANCSSNTCIITYNDDTKRYIGIKDKGEDETINYCSDSGLSSCTYDKKLNSSLSEYQLSVEKKENYYIFKISAQNIFAKDSDYFINISIYNIEEIINIGYTLTIKSNVEPTKTYKSSDGKVTFSVTGTKEFPFYSRTSCDPGVIVTEGKALGNLTDFIETKNLTVSNITKDTTCTVTFKANAVVTPDPGEENCSLVNGITICDT